jgi:hypothetical protein
MYARETGRIGVAHRILGGTSDRAFDLTGKLLLLGSLLALLLRTGAGAG